MSSEDKAKELYAVFADIISDNYGADPHNTAKECARAAVKQIMLENVSNDVQYNVMDMGSSTFALCDFYELVKAEINLL